MKIQPKKWREFQHYSDRAPPWIKLHSALLDDYEYQTLPLASKALAPMLWLLASKNREGTIDATPEKLAFRLRWPVSDISDALSPLIGKGFFEVIDGDASTLLASCAQSACSETEREAEGETETETPLVPLPRDDGQQAAKRQRQKSAIQLLDFLNAKAGKHFRPVAANLRFIEARLADGITLQDLKTLTARKCREWLGTDQAKYLRPETLYNPTKCHGYLGEIAPEAPCNVLPATEASRQEPSHAPADGAPPISHAAPPALQ